MKRGPDRLAWGRWTLFASGDFAFNLYWQSISFYLLFFYTDTLRISPALAGTIFLVGAIADGIADLMVGIAAERSRRGYRWLMLAGTVPLGIAFALLYWAISTAAIWLIAVHLAVRCSYALSNVPYTALSVRISTDSAVRARVAGLRMLVGTAAAIVVALSTDWILGVLGQAEGFRTAGIAFAATATLWLLLVGATAPAGRPLAAHPFGGSVARSLRALFRNRAFVTLNCAAVASAVAGTALTSSILYYFRYVALDAGAGAATLAMMGGVAALAIPLWMLIQTRSENRLLWLMAAGLAVSALAGLGLVHSRTVLIAQVLIVTAQAGMVGLNLAFWSMLPDTVEYGEYSGGVRVEAIAFGVAALLQKLAIGIAVWALGLAYQISGYRPDMVQTAAATDMIRLIAIGLPVAGLLLSMLSMLANPLRRGTHRKLVAELAVRERGEGR